MNRALYRIIFLIWIFTAGLSSHARAASNDLIRLGSVEIDTVQRAVIATGWVNQVSGPIELLACGKTGKLHESIFVMNIDPKDLHAALLLLGLKPGQGPTGLGAGRPEGPGLYVWVEWEVDGLQQKERVESLIYNARTEQALPPILWTFTGSVVENGDYKATAEDSLIASYWDPWAVINISHPTGGDDDALYALGEKLPPAQTPVRFMLMPLSLDDPVPLR